MTTLPASIEESLGREPTVLAAPNTAVFIGLFAFAGFALAGLQAAAAATAVFAAFLSLMLAGLSLIAVHDDPANAYHRAMRTGVRLLAPVLMATLLWLAIVVTRSALGVSAAASVVALPAFAVFLLLEGLASAALQFVLARASGTEPGIPAALLVADKYSGLAGELR